MLSFDAASRLYTVIYKDKTELELKEQDVMVGVCAQHVYGNISVISSPDALVSFRISRLSRTALAPVLGRRDAVAAARALLRGPLAVHPLVQW